MNLQLNVYCDFLSGAQSWVVLQRRVDASVDFYLNWADYKAWFGDKNGNYWIGLDTMHKLARPGMGATLRFDMKHRNSPSTAYYAEYTIFEVGDEASGYKLLIGGYSGKNINVKRVKMYCICRRACFNIQSVGEIPHQPLQCPHQSCPFSPQMKCSFL